MPIADIDEQLIPRLLAAMPGWPCGTLSDEDEANCRLEDISENPPRSKRRRDWGSDRNASPGAGKHRQGQNRKSPKRCKKRKNKKG